MASYNVTSHSRQIFALLCIFFSNEHPVLMNTLKCLVGTTFFPHHESELLQNNFLSNVVGKEHFLDTLQFGRKLKVVIFQNDFITADLELQETWFPPISCTSYELHCTKSTKGQKNFFTCFLVEDYTKKEKTVVILMAPIILMQSITLSIFLFNSISNTAFQQCTHENTDTYFPFNHAMSILANLTVSYIISILITQNACWGDV